MLIRSTITHILESSQKVSETPPQYPQKQASLLQRNTHFGMKYTFFHKLNKNFNLNITSYGGMS